MGVAYDVHVELGGVTDGGSVVAWRPVSGGGGGGSRRSEQQQQHWRCADQARPMPHGNRWPPRLHGLRSSGGRRWGFAAG